MIPEVISPARTFDGLAYRAALLDAAAALRLDVVVAPAFLTIVLTASSPNP